MNTNLENRIDFGLQMSKQVKPLNGASDKTNNPEALRAVAKEFESLFMNMMLKSMRSANRTLSEGNYFNSFESKMYEDMLDEKLSVQLSDRGGLGIADLLMRQFSPDVREPRYDLPMGSAKREADFESPAGFVSRLMDDAGVAARQLDVKPEFIVAQAALETGWGQRIMHDGAGRNSHNLFGIKANADWTGPTIAIDSLEIVDGVAQQVKSEFKMYDSYQQAFTDYAQLIAGHDRYAAVKNTQTVEDFTRGLEQGGYATDPDYGQKVARVLNDITGKHLAMRK